MNRLILTPTAKPAIADSAGMCHITTLIDTHSPLVNSSVLSGVIVWKRVALTLKDAVAH